MNLGFSMADSSGERQGSSSFSAARSFRFFQRFQISLEFAKRLDAMTIVFADPAVINLMNRDRVEVMKFFTAAPDDGQEVCFLEQKKMLCDGLAGHEEVGAKVVESLAVLGKQKVEETSAAFVGE